MSKVKEYKRLQRRYSEIDRKVETLLKPLVEERSKKYAEIEKWFNTEYEKVEPQIDTLYDEQSSIEDALMLLESTLKECENCGNYVDKFDKEAEESGFDYCEACAPSIDRCDHCETMGEWGSNYIKNGIHNTDCCGMGYCDACGEPDCGCEEEE